MAVYCMSDIHGQLNAFHEMLDIIRFSDEDTLYIIGDVVDRGPCGIELLQETMRRPNIVMMLGNHELMMLQCLGPSGTKKQMAHWNLNPNGATKRKFYRLTKNEQDTLLSYIDGLPDTLEIRVGNQDYMLVHGMPGCNRHEAVWGRPIAMDIDNPVPGRRLIIGHTPVSYLLCGTEEKESVYLRQLEKNGEHVRILHTTGFIDIDCSCGYPFRSCALGCLRLDDGMEFYVPVATELQWE